MEKQFKLTGQLNDSLWLQAIMYFPEDAHLRESWYAVELAGGHIEAMELHQEIKLDRATFKALLDSPSQSFLKERKLAASKKGYLAGMVLVNLYLMNIYGVKEPSIKKAIHLVKKTSEDSKYGDGASIPKSQKSVREALRGFNSVAHFWGALWFLVNFNSSEKDRVFFEMLDQFLGVSKELFLFGTKHISTRNKSSTPTIDSKNAWTLDTDIGAIRLSGNDISSEIIHRQLSDYDSTEYQY